MEIQLPQKVQFIIETLNQAGFEAYAVGGCVRDSIDVYKRQDIRRMLLQRKQKSGPFRC